jgi:hypothetical protein
MTLIILDNALKNSGNILIFSSDKSKHVQPINNIPNNIPIKINAKSTEYKHTLKRDITITDIAGKSMLLYIIKSYSPSTPMPRNIFTLAISQNGKYNMAITITSTITSSKIIRPLPFS